MLRVPVLRDERERAAHAAVVKMIEAARAAGVDAELPPAPAERPPRWLVVEPPADMSTLPEGARKAILAALLSTEQGIRTRSAAVTVEAVDAAYQAAAEICCACIVGVEVEGQPVRTVRVRAQADASPGVLPLSAIDREERLAVMGAVQRHLATFRDLL